ncbi:MAG: hypothetical protein PHD51_01840 [Patescibacteria group bacterium]|nr:hypothetical protein [Patescibacteria group bacterium]MDD5490396.1 hypothetical protein [Patescibacteria group bacterium]
MYGSDSNGNPLGSDEAKKIQGILNIPEVAAKIFVSDEEYEKELDKKFRRKFLPKNNQTE